MDIRVEFEMTIPDCTAEEILEWVRYKLGNNGDMSCENPLVDLDLDAYYVRVKS